MDLSDSSPHKEKAADTEVSDRHGIGKTELVFIPIAEHYRRSHLIYIIV